MLTVNIVCGGNQRTVEAKEVIAKATTISSFYDEIELIRYDDWPLLIGDGQVFVMNEAGSTVAKYDLRQNRESSEPKLHVAGSADEEARKQRL